MKALPYNFPSHARSRGRDPGCGHRPQRSYVTNATNVVKHFKWEPRGKRRIHKKPNAVEIVACRPWLVARYTLSPHPRQPR